MRGEGLPYGFDAREVRGRRLGPGRRQEDEAEAELLLRGLEAGEARTFGVDHLRDGHGLGPGLDLVAHLVPGVGAHRPVAQQGERSHVLRVEEAHQVKVERRVDLLDARRAIVAIGFGRPVGAVHERGVAVEEVAPVGIGAQEVERGGGARSGPVAGVGQPLVPHFVGQHPEGRQEAGGAGREAAAGLAPSRHRRHVDVALEPARAAEIRGHRPHRLADALDVVAHQVVEGQGGSRLELEVGEHHQEVVVVAVRLVETPGHRIPRLVVGAAVALPPVVVRAIVLDDHDPTLVAHETRGGGSGGTGGPFRGEPGPAGDAPRGEEAVAGGEAAAQERDHGDEGDARDPPAARSKACESSPCHHECTALSSPSPRRGETSEER